MPDLLAKRNALSTRSEGAEVAEEAYIYTSQYVAYVAMRQLINVLFAVDSYEPTIAAR